MDKRYVENRDGGLWIAGTRISLDSIVLAYLQGLSPETIAAECFPTLNLEQVYGAITHYLAHRDEIDAYLSGIDAEFETLRRSTRNASPALSEKLAQARRQVQAARR